MDEDANDFELFETTTHTNNTLFRGIWAHHQAIRDSMDVATLFFLYADLYCPWIIIVNKTLCEDNSLTITTSNKQFITFCDHRKTHAYHAHETRVAHNPSLTASLSSTISAFISLHLQSPKWCENHSGWYYSGSDPCNSIRDDVSRFIVIMLSLVIVIYGLW